MYYSKKFRHYNEVIDLLIENFLEFVDENGDIIIAKTDSTKKDSDTSDADSISEEHLDLLKKFKK